MTCREIMTPNPTCCRGDHTIDQAAQLMKEEDVGLLPVVMDDSGKLIGVLTDRDIVMKVVAGSRDAQSTEVSDVMTANPMACRPQDTSEAALEIMKAHQVRRVPVVDEAGLVVGIIAQADVATRLGRPEQTGKVVQAISEDDRRIAGEPGVV
jgi:CBS domain-containing protein